MFSLKTKFIVVFLAFVLQIDSIFSLDTTISKSLDSLVEKNTNMRKYINESFSTSNKIFYPLTINGAAIGDGFLPIKEIKACKYTSPKICGCFR